MRSFTRNNGTKKWNKLLSRATCRYLLFFSGESAILCLLVSKGKRLRKWDKYLEQSRLDPCTCYLSTHLALHVILLFPQLRQFLVEETSFPRNLLVFFFSFIFFFPFSFSFFISFSIFFLIVFQTSSFRLVD